MAGIGRGFGARPPWFDPGDGSPLCTKEVRHVAQHLRPSLPRHNFRRREALRRREARCVVDGCPPRIALDAADIQAELDRRRPGASRFTTQRREPDDGRRPRAFPPPRRGSAALGKRAYFGAIDLESGQTRMVEAESIDAKSTIRLLEALEALYPFMVCIHVFLDNASYHHAKLVKEWLSRPGRRIKLHFLPAFCPHLNPIERLWGVMHKNITHNKCYQTRGEFAEATLVFLRDEVPRRWAELCDSVTDNFRIISPKDFRLLG